MSDHNDSIREIPDSPDLESHGDVCFQDELQDLIDRDEILILDHDYDPQSNEAVCSDSTLEEAVEDTATSEATHPKPIDGILAELDLDAEVTEGDFIPTVVEKGSGSRHRGWALLAGILVLMVSGGVYYYYIHKVKPSIEITSPTVVAAIRNQSEEPSGMTPKLPTFVQRPTTPEAPAIPDYPTIPGETVPPEGPETPETPEPPVNPAPTEAPVTPEAPITPEPVAPDIPVIPEAPATPDKPVVPENPVSPEAPVTPEPVSPENPVTPEAPATPDKPVSPENPVTPEMPITPDNPVSPEEPVVPEKPSIPEVHVTPANPKSPDKVVTPGNPEPREVLPDRKPATVSPTHKPDSPERIKPPAPEKTPTSVKNPRTAAQDLKALNELIHMGLEEGFSRIKLSQPKGVKGIKVQLSGGREITLAPEESLVELKNGNYFKGYIESINKKYLSLAFSYGTILIPKGDLNQVIPISSSEYRNNEGYRMGIVYLQNGNRLSGKIIKVKNDRVVIGFPSAQIVIPRSAMIPGNDAVEYIEADSRDRCFGVSENRNSADGGKSNISPEKSAYSLGVPYYDFVNGFSLVPPNNWQRYSMDAVIGFHALASSKARGALNLGGLFMESSDLETGLRKVAASLHEQLKGIHVIQRVKKSADKAVPWDFEFECKYQPKQTSRNKAKKTPEPSKHSKTYIYNKYGRVFVLTVFSLEKDFAGLKNLFDRCAKTFDFKN